MYRCLDRLTGHEVCDLGGFQMRGQILPLPSSPQLPRKLAKGAQLLSSIRLPDTTMPNEAERGRWLTSDKTLWWLRRSRVRRLVMIGHIPQLRVIALGDPTWQPAIKHRHSVVTKGCVLKSEIHLPCYSSGLPLNVKSPRGAEKIPSVSYTTTWVSFEIPLEPVKHKRGLIFSS